MVAEQVQDNSKFTAVRLPTNIKPVNYKLKLKPDFVKFTFQGSVEIQYEGDGAAKEIVLHAVELEILDGSLTDGGSTSKLSRVTYSKDTATLEFDQGVPKSGTLSLDFNGILNEKMKGFYKTQFSLDGETVYAATTQFEATDARRCFPCWDEPAIKSTFTVSLVINPKMSVKGKDYTRVALSNMPETSRKELGQDEVEVFFAESPIMSTYLLAFIVGPFDYLEGSDGKRPIRVYTAPGKTEQGRYALQVACKSLPYYEEYFNVPYPLPKMDMIAIPDFTSGAMENWGLVTYRETCLLVDEGNTSTVVKQYVALVVAHELAHQWFGNLVTMEWWTHLWLNEGFASFMEFLCVDHIFPEYDIWSQFVTDAYSEALNLDSLHNSHPIEVPVNHPSEIDEIFDSISYNKGASVIRMMYNYIGDEMFRKGMKDYLNKHAYKNAVTEDLWAALEAASGKPICKFMSGWTSQKGFPWLSVSASTEGNNLKLAIEQNKFSADGSVPDGDKDATWLLPISVITGSKPTEPASVTLLEGRRGEVTVEGAGDDWCKLNPGTINLYRVAYPVDMSQKLWPAISNQTLPPMDRLGLQNDFFALCRAGKVNTVDLLTLLNAFKSETNYTVWNSIDHCISELGLLMANTDFRDQFKAYGRALYSEIFKKLTWEPKSGEKHTDAMLRPLIVNRLVALDDEHTLAEAKSRFKNHVAKTALIPADLRKAVYRAVAAHGDDESFEALFHIFRTEELQEEKMRAGRSLGFATNPERVKRVVDFAFSDEVRNQDRVFIIMPIGAVNPLVAWKVLQDKKDYIREIYETGHMIPRWVKFCTEGFVSEEIANEISEFFEKNKFPGAERSIQQSLETIRLNAAWLKRDQSSIKEFLSK